MRPRLRISLIGLFVIVTLLGAGLAWTVQRRRQKEQATRALIVAVEQRKLPATLSALREGADPSAIDAPQAPPLTLGHLFASQDPAASDTDVPPSVLIIAAQNHEGAILEALLRAGANANAGTYQGRTALLCVEQGGLGAERIAALRLLLAHGARVNDRDHFGISPLMKADDEDETAILLAAGADVKARDKKNRTALWYAELARIQQESAPDADLMDTGAGHTNPTALRQAELKESAARIALLKRAGSPPLSRRELLDLTALADPTTRARRVDRSRRPPTNGSAARFTPKSL